MELLQLSLDLFKVSAPSLSNESLMEKAKKAVKTIEECLKQLPEQEREELRKQIIRQLEGNSTTQLLVFPQRELVQPISEATGNLIVKAGQCVMQLLAEDHALTPKILSQLMSELYGGTDAQGKWHWKDAYDALEVGIILYLRKQSSVLLTKDNMEILSELSMLEKKLPTQTRRSEETQQLQQFSTPLSLSYLVAKAAMIESTDLVLEPSGGNGMLAIWAELTAGSKLILNELYRSRRDNLKELFPNAVISGYNGEQINDYLDVGLRPNVVIMNPPFSASPKIRKRNNFATLNHVSSALQRLEKGGRLVTITANWFSPNSPDWSTYFKQFENRGCQVVFSAGIEGKAYSKHGTTIDTRLTVIEKLCPNQQRNVIDEVLTLTALAESISLYVPSRSSEESSQSPKKAIEIPKIQTTPVVKGVFEDVIEIEYELINWDGSDKEIGDGIYEAYEPQAIRIKGAKPHPTPLVQSAAMAAIAPPKPTYKPMLPKRLLVEEILSAAQIETVISYRSLI